MAVVVLDAPPFIPVKPKIAIGAVANQLQIECAANELSVEVDQDETTIETWCGSYTTYKPEQWTITVAVFPSYGLTGAGTIGLWNNLRPLVGSVQDFEILPNGAAVASPTNPKMSGKCLVKAFPFYMGAVGEPQSFDLEIAVQGVPTFAVA